MELSVPASIGTILMTSRNREAISRYEAPEPLDDFIPEGNDADGIALLWWAIRDRFRGRFALVSSFGAHSAVLLDMVARVDPATAVIFLDTGQSFPETLAYQRDLVARLGLTDVRRVCPDPGFLRRADPRGMLWESDPDRCCHVRKVAPLEAALVGFQAWITGRKRFQGGYRSSLPSVEYLDGRYKINPLAGWTEDRIESYFHERDLPAHPLYNQGYLSIGCQPCTRPATDLSDARSGRWCGKDKTECGIHASPAFRPLPFEKDY